MNSIETGSCETSVTVDSEPKIALRNLFLMTETFATGGSERQFSALARNLDRHQFRVMVGCMRRDGAFLDGIGDVAAFPLGKSLYKPASWLARLRLARYLRAHGVEVAQAFDFYTNLTLLPAAYGARVPVIIGSQRQLGDLLTANQFKAQLLAFRLADAVVCNSKAASHLLQAAGLPETKLAVIQNGVPEHIFVPAPPAFQRVQGEFRVGMIARMNSESKNHSVLLRSIPLLRKRVPQVQVFLVGEGHLRPELERESRELGITDCVRFLGDRRDIPSVLASLDVTVLPSRSESLSNAIIESMAQGVPVVASRVGGNEELLGDGRGILVPAEDHEAIAHALADLLLNETLRRDLGSAAKAFARANYTIERMCRSYAELYMRLLEQKR